MRQECSVDELPMKLCMDFSHVHAGDEIVVSKIKGVRFWGYQFESHPGYCPILPRSITSWQHDISWTANRPAEPDEVPTMGNGRGLNVYKTIKDALEGSAEAVNGVIEDVHGHWINSGAGIILGTVEIWGCVIEHERGYRAQYVKPVSFDRAWGAEPERILDDLNTLWFAKDSSLSFDDKILLAIQRGSHVCSADIGYDLRKVMNVLSTLEDKGFVCWKSACMYPNVWKQQLHMAHQQGMCLCCNKPVSHTMCTERAPRLYQITTNGQEALLASLRR